MFNPKKSLVVIISLRKFSIFVISALFYTIIIGCAGHPFIKPVSYNMKPGMLHLESKTVEVAGKTFNAEEGFLIVNEDPSDRLSRKIKLPLLRIRSVSKNPDEPIFWLNGGPGQTNMSYCPLIGLLENHDFVMLGYRGVDGSTILRSREVEDSFKGTDSNLLDSTSLHSISQTLESFATELADEGVDIDHYTMADVVDDIEAARRALHYKKIHLLGLSYGTRVALVYSHMYPAAISRSVMVGANPPGNFLWYPKKIDEQFARYDSLFAADSSYDGRPLSQSIHNGLVNMPSYWTLFRLDPGKIKVITFVMLFEKGNAALVFNCYRAAEQGDYSGLYILQRFYDYMMPTMFVWGDFMAKGSTDFDADVDYVSILQDSTTVMGSPLSLLICSAAVGHWPVHRLPPGLNQVQPSDIPTLLINGSLDFSTPAKYATQGLLPYLSNGHQVILREMGHVGDLMWRQRAAMDHLLCRYYDEGVVDDSQFIYEPVNFDAKVNFPLWAKVLYPFVLIQSLF